MSRIDIPYASMTGPQRRAHEKRRKALALRVARHFWDREVAAAAEHGDTQIRWSLLCDMIRKGSIMAHRQNLSIWVLDTADGLLAFSALADAHGNGSTVPYLTLPDLDDWAVFATIAERSILDRFLKVI